MHTGIVQAIQSRRIREGRMAIVKENGGERKMLLVSELIKLEKGSNENLGRDENEH